MPKKTPTPYAWPNVLEDKDANKMLNQADYFRANNTFRIVLAELEDAVATSYSLRHDYPIWPTHDGLLNEFEDQYHGPLRNIYYENVKLLVRVLREMRKLN